MDTIYNNDKKSRIQKIYGIEKYNTKQKTCKKQKH